MNDTVREYLNETVIENDVFEDIVNRTSHQQTIDIGEKYFIISEFVELISNVVNISAYLFLVITILRFKKLSTRTNTYILHLSLLYAIFAIAKLILNTLFVSIDSSLVLEQASTSVLFLYLLICLILGLDWFLSGYKPNFIEKYGPFQKHFLVVLYGIALTEYLLTFVYTHMHHMIRMGISRFFYALIILFMFVLNAMKRSVTLNSHSAKTAYAFNVSSIIIFSLIPMFICDTILWTHYDNYILVCISIIPEILWYNHPIIVVYVLGMQNKHFKMAYTKSFKKSVQSYDDEDFIDESEEWDNIVVDNNSRNKVETTQDNLPDNNFRQTSAV